MNLRIDIRSVPKAGNADDENEDRAGFEEVGDLLRLAIADGATESSFSGLWADALVTTWTRREHPTVDREFLEASRQSWIAGLPAPETLPWYAQEKLDMGSHASLACFTVATRRRGFAWSGQIVGDCEIFLLKGAGRLWLRRKAPIDRAADFGSTPRLASTVPASWDDPVSEQIRGRLHHPFEMWLTTDAFAHACLAAAEDGRAPWSGWSIAMESAEGFADEVHRARQRGEMRNDDVTVIRVQES